MYDIAYIYMHDLSDLWWYIYIHPPTCGCLHVGNIPFSPWWIMPASPGYDARFMGMKVDDQTSPPWCILVIYNLHHVMCIYVYIFISLCTYLYIYIKLYEYATPLPNLPFQYVLGLFSLPCLASVSLLSLVVALQWIFWTLDLWMCSTHTTSCCLRLVHTNVCWKQQCLDFQCTMLVNKKCFPHFFPLWDEQCLSRKNCFSLNQ